MNADMGCLLALCDKSENDIRSCVNTLQVCFHYTKNRRKCSSRPCAYESRSFASIFKLYLIQNFICVHTDPTLDDSKSETNTETTILQKQ